MSRDVTDMSNPKVPTFGCREIGLTGFPGSLMVLVSPLGLKLHQKHGF